MEYRDLERRLTRLSAEMKLGQDAVEKTIRMSEILDRICSDSRLSYLAFKGGTALNFVYLKKLKRLSVDLDFNAIGKKKELLDLRDNAMDTALREAAEVMGYEVEIDKSYFRYSYHFLYDRLDGAEDYIKVEISFRDRVAVLPLKLSKFRFSGSGKSIQVRTLSFVEMLAEKLRALYTRESGRDLFDVFNALEMVTPRMEPILRKSLIYKLFRATPPSVFDPGDFLKKINNFQEKRYAQALTGFVSEENQVPFELARARTAKVLEFIRKIDAKDTMYIGLFRCLLGQNVSKEMINKIRDEKGLARPLNYLFDAKSITKMARLTELSDVLPTQEIPFKKYPWLNELIQQ